MGMKEDLTQEVATWIRMCIDHDISQKVITFEAAARESKNAQEALDAATIEQLWGLFYRYAQLERPIRHLCVCADHLGFMHGNLCVGCEKDGYLHT